jgi:hypothetical protein
MRKHSSVYELTNKILNISEVFDRVDIHIIPNEGVRVINNPYNHVKVEDMLKYGFKYTGKSSIRLGRNEFIRFFKNTTELRKWIKLEESK